MQPIQAIILTLLIGIFVCNVVVVKDIRVAGFLRHTTQYGSGISEGAGPWALWFVWVVVGGCALAL